ncbi:VanZ family protein [Lentzea sp. NPDC055074]
MLDAILFVYSDPLTAGGTVVGAVAFGAGGWFAAPRFGWRPVPSVFAGIFLGLVLALTFSRSLPSWALTGTEFCLLNGFSLDGVSELFNALLLVPPVWFAVLATRRPLAVLVSAVALSAAIEVLQPLVGRGLCETQDFLNNSAGAVVAAALAGGYVALRDRAAGNALRRSGPAPTLPPVGMLDAVAARVARGEKVRFRPTGSSMVPLIHSRQRVTVAPVDTAKLEVDDIVLVRVAGTTYLHRVTAIAGQRVQIGNNRGRINGWTSRERVFGLCVDVDGVPRKNIEGKVVLSETAENT